jgi:hypothetical protein
MVPSKNNMFALNEKTMGRTEKNRILKGCQRIQITENAAGTTKKQGVWTNLY